MALLLPFSVSSCTSPSTGNCLRLTTQSALHVFGVYLFTTGFLLTRLVLPHKSNCAVPPVDLAHGYVAGDAQKGCWHPKTYDKAIVVIVDALRYDFTVPFAAQFEAVDLESQADRAQAASSEKNIAPRPFH